MAFGEQVVCWLLQHGAAAIQLNADFNGALYKEELCDTLRPNCWSRYDHGFNVLPMLLPNLRHLLLSSFTGFMVAKHDLYSIQTHLTHLQTLDLDLKSDGRWNLQTLNSLCHLMALERLQLLVEGLIPKPMLLPAAPSRLSLLASLTLINNDNPDGPQSPGWGMDCSYDTQNAGNVISLVLLRNLDLKCLINSIPI